MFTSPNKFIKKTRFKDLSDDTNYVSYVLIFF